MVEKILSKNTITLARALLATSMLLTLIFTPLDNLFPHYHISKLNESSNELMNLNYFLWFDNLLIPYIFSITILIIVILGLFPRLICIFHSWVSYSVFYSMLIVEGGDQINIILTFLLIPICILDKRRNGWINILNDSKKKKTLLSINSMYALLFIKIQMAILYLNAGISKMFAPEWSNGTAVYYWFYDNMFGAPIWVQNSIGFLFKNDLTISLINWSVIFLEMGLFIAFFLNQKYKYLLLLLGLLFHFTIILIHGLPTFFLAMSAGLILYLSKVDLSIKENIINIKKSIQYAKKRI
jgi:antimicrobial peptide system SdpB family protein